MQNAEEEILSYIFPFQQTTDPRLRLHIQRQDMQAHLCGASLSNHTGLDTFSAARDLAYSPAWNYCQECVAEYSRTPHIHSRGETGDALCGASDATEFETPDNLDLDCLDCLKVTDQER